jgi:hypothetical protein
MDIIERLDGKAQSKMSRVSKMYLKATERILYKNIKIDQRVGRLNRLLYTLLVRPDLANSVNSFELVNRAWVPRPFSPKTVDFRKHRKYMGKAVSKLSKLFPTPYVEQWLLGNHKWNQNDHTLGLIFCLATNLESIDIDTENPSFKWTRQLLETNWQTETWLDPSDLENMEIHDVYPFQKLHTFRVKDKKTLCDCAPASPALRILSLSHRPWLTEIVTKRLLARGQYSDRQYHPLLSTKIIQNSVQDCTPWSFTLSAMIYPQWNLSLAVQISG